MTDQQARAALKPCPFCGDEAELDSLDGATGHQHFASCKNTGCPGYHHGPFTTYARKVEAVAAWNRRASAPIAEPASEKET